LTSVQWTVVVTVEAPNLVPGEGAVEANVLGMSAVLASERGSLQREVTLTVEAADEVEAERVALDQLTSGLGGGLAGVPEIESIRVEPDE
jgi:hypothetical protein